MIIAKYEAKIQKAGKKFMFFSAFLVPPNVTQKLRLKLAGSIQTTALEDQELVYVKKLSRLPSSVSMDT